MEKQTLAAVLLSVVVLTFHGTVTGDGGPRPGFPVRSGPSSPW